MEIFLDADLILEALMHSIHLADDTKNILEILQSEQIQGYACDVGINKIKSFIEKLTKNPEDANKVISTIKETIKICHVDCTHLQEARSLNILDFESAVEVACATQKNISVIVTHDPQRFDGSNLTTLKLRQVWQRQDFERILQKPTLLTGNLIDVQRLEHQLSYHLKQEEDCRELNLNRTTFNLKASETSESSSKASLDNLQSANEYERQILQIQQDLKVLVEDFLNEKNRSKDISNQIKELEIKLSEIENKKDILRTQDINLIEIDY